MTTTPPDAPEPQPGETGDHPGQASGPGPRVGPSQLRDVSRLRRTTGPWRQVGGVAGGLARHFDVDPLLIRVAFVILTFFGGAGLVVYVGCWLLLPEDGADRAPVQLDTKALEIGLVVLAVLGVMLVLGVTFGDGTGWPLALAAVVVGIVLLARRSDAGAASTPPPPPGAGPGAAPWLAPPEHGSATTGQPAAPYAHGSYGGPAPAAYLSPPDPRRRGPRLFWPTLMVVLLGWGVLGMVDVTGTDIPPTAYPALAVALTGLALLVSSAWGRGGGLIALGLAGTLALGVSSIADVADHEPLTVTPTTELGSSYSHGAGDYTLDLTRLDPQMLDGRRVRVEGGVGRLVVVVPDDIDVDLTARVGLGDLRVFDQEQRGGAGLSVTQSHDSSEGTARFELDAQLGVGELQILDEGAVR